MSLRVYITIAALLYADLTSAIPAPSAASSEPVNRTVFTIAEYQVAGNTLLPVIDIERAVWAHLGPERGIVDVEAARTSLEKAYHDRGYLTVQVDIPVQKVLRGVVTLNVTEAPVARLRVTGSRYYSLGAIRDSVPELAEGTVPNFLEVQNELGQLNRSADRQVTPVLRASTTPGAVDVDLQVKDKLPVHGSLEVNDRYSPNTSRTRLLAQLGYDNLFQRNQSLSVQYQVAPEEPDDTRVISASYAIPTRSGPVWALYAVDSASDIAAVGDLDVIGNGQIYGARYIRPLPPGDNGFYHSLTAGLDYKDFDEETVFEGAGSFTTPISYAPMSLQYRGTWAEPFFEPAWGPGSALSLRVGSNFLVRGLGTDAQEFADKRSGAGPSFFVLQLGLELDQMLPASWKLRANLDGQIANGPLVSNEQFSAGGAESVRGYLESERLGDNGWRANLELHTPDLLGGISERIDTSYLLFFVEGAGLRVLDALPGQDSHYWLSSLGLGVRFSALGLNMDLDAAHVLQDAYVTQAGDNRGHFRVSYAF